MKIDLMKQAHSIARRTAKNLIVSPSGGIREVQASGCVITWTSCDEEHETLSTELQPGETFLWGDWNGSECIRKEYTCPSVDSIRAEVSVDGKVKKCNCPSSAATTSAGSNAILTGCFTFYNPRDRRYLGIRNNCDKCKICVFNWNDVGVFYYPVNAYDQSEVLIPPAANGGRQLGEQPCDT